MSENKKCADLINDELKSRIDDITKLWKADQNGVEYVEDLGSFNEYGLCFDFVFNEDKPHEPYFRYQLSWGGPSDEFRIFAHGQDYNWTVYRIEYWYLNWFDGAHLVLTGEDYDLIKEIFSYFAECGTCQSAYDNIM